MRSSPKTSSTSARSGTSAASTARAERYYRDALAITEGWYGKEHFKTGSNLTMLGRSLQMQARLDEASDVLERAVAIQERVSGRCTRVSRPRSTISAPSRSGAAVRRRRGGVPADAGYLPIGVWRRTTISSGSPPPTSAASTPPARTNDVPSRSIEKRLRSSRRRRVTQHLNTGIARLKLGDSLVAQERYGEAEKELLARLRDPDDADESVGELAQAGSREPR